MKKSSLLLLSLFITFSCTQKKQKSEPASKPSAETLMAESMQRFSSAWNQGNAEEISKEFTADAIRIVSNPLSPIVGQESILKSFDAVFSEGSDLENSHIEITVTETRSVSEDIYLGAGSFAILSPENEILEQGKWGNVFKYDNGQIKFLMESAHRQPKEANGSETETVLENSIASDEPHFDKIVLSVKNYIENSNSKNSEGISMLFTEEGIQSVDGKDGIIMGRQQIKDTEIYADGNELNANVMGYRYLGNNIAIAYGNWSSTSDDNAKVTGQWGNLFKIEGDEALLIMESAGMIQ
ncbi:MAG: nuclear transport factor 2 family protein [Flavobacteriaceae bacterium]|nr:nuclear transport factor 2 family protein [Flavobacteriaceae bacterium]MDG2387310.1 nuclear transport factor 2 family protein [Flavobacteriaceae bacterium]